MSFHQPMERNFMDESQKPTKARKSADGPFEVSDWLRIVERNQKIVGAIVLAGLTAAWRWTVHQESRITTLETGLHNVGASVDNLASTVTKDHADTALTLNNLSSRIDAALIARIPITTAAPQADAPEIPYGMDDGWQKLLILTRTNAEETK